MNEIEIKNWTEYGRSISEESIRSFFPRPEYRVTPRLCRANKIIIPGAARSGLLFVLEGKCKCSFGQKIPIFVTLDAGQYINFPEGSYEIEPLEDKDAKIAFVWNVAKVLEKFFPGHPRQA